MQCLISGSDLTANEIYSLLNCGVQILNVDRTVHDETYFLNIRTAINELQEMHTMTYYRPCALSITMSLNDPVQFDENVSYSNCNKGGALSLANVTV